MLSVMDIIKALSDLIEENFPNYPVCDVDIEENYPRPSYFIDVDNIKGENVTNNYVKETCEIQVYFFAENRYEGFIDLLNMKNKLLVILNEPLKIQYKNLTAHVVFNNVSVEISKADKALRCEMVSELIQSQHVEEYTTDDGKELIREKNPMDYYNYNFNKKYETMGKIFINTKNK